MTTILHSSHRNKHLHKESSRTVDQGVIPFTPKVKFDLVHVRLPVDFCVCGNAFILVSRFPQVKQEVSDIVRSGL